MTAQAKLDLLVELAKGLVAHVRYESMEGAGGGLCKLRDKSVLFVDIDADPQTAYERVLAALAENFNLESIYIRPEIRQDLDTLSRHPE